MISKVKDVMTPEETFNQQVWEVLQNIKEEYLAKEIGQPIEYELPHSVGVGIIPRERRRDIYYKLQERGAIKILSEFPPDWRGSGKHLLKYQVLQPKFDEIYKKFQKACDINSYLNDYQEKAFKNEDLPKFSQVGQEELEINKWLESKEDWTIRKIWQAVSALNSEWQLRDENTFDIPHDKFERARVTNPKDLEAILRSLHKKAIIEVSKKVAETPPSNDPNKPQGSLWVTIIEQPEIAQQAKTQVRIFPKKFKYLRDILFKMVSKQSLKENEQAEKQYSENLVWPEDFRWENKNFVFGEYGSIDFKSRDRDHIFKILTDKQGGWATINELKGNKDAGYVRSTIKQIEDRLPEKAKGHIKIVSTQDDDGIEKPNTGAYRIKVQP